MLQTALPFDRVERRPSLPYSGRTALSRACSRAAAKAVSARRVTKTLTYLAWLREHGPATDHRAADALRLPLSSVNSIRNGVIERARREGCPVPIRAAGEVVGPYGTPNTAWEVAA